MSTALQGAFGLIGVPRKVDVWFTLISAVIVIAITAFFKTSKFGRQCIAVKGDELAAQAMGINASRFFTLTYGKTLNVGRVMSPTLALLVQREAEIAAFVPEPYYTVHLNCGFDAVSERFADKAAAEQIMAECGGKAMVKAINRVEKSQ